MARRDNIRRCLEQRRQVVADMRSLAGKADTEKRVFKPDEHVRWNELKVQFDTLGDQLDEARHQNGGGNGDEVEIRLGDDGATYRRSNAATGLEEFRSACVRPPPTPRSSLISIRAVGYEA